MKYATIISENPFKINYIEGDFVKSITKNIKVIFEKDIYYINIEVRNTYFNNTNEIATHIYDAYTEEPITFKIDLDNKLAYELVEFSKSEMNTIIEFNNMMLN